MDLIIGLISTVAVWIFAVPIIICAIKAVKFRKSMTKQLWERIYKTSIICSSMIFIFSFITSISYKIGVETDIKLLLGDVLVELVLKMWAFPVAIYFIWKKLKNMN